MSPEEREIVGKTFEQFCEVKDFFTDKYLRDFPLDEEHPLNGAGVSLSNYNRGRARFILHIYILQEPTPELLKSLSLPKRSFKGVPVKYMVNDGFYAHGARNQFFE